MSLHDVLLPVRAAWIVERERARHVREQMHVHRHALVSSLLMFLGLGGALAGGALVGEWCLGLVVIAESGLAFWFGLYRDDGKPPPARGLLSHEEILARERARPWEPS